MNTNISISETEAVHPQAIGNPGLIRPAHIHALAGALLVAAFAWSYAPTLAELWAFWQRNEDYSVGQLVPPVALYLLWRRRAALSAVPLEPCWWGIGILLGAQLLRLCSAAWEIASVERYSIPLSVAGMVLLVGGRDLLRKTQWIIAFLFLMVPLPSGIHERIAVPLQSWATTIAVFVLELCGYFVVREGNVLSLEGRTVVAVSEACSGLRMLTAFVFVAAVLAFVMQRPRWQRITMLAASVPIAVVSNAVRVVATAIYACFVNSAERVEPFHDIAGLLMMPFGLALSLGLLALLDRLVVKDAPEISHVSGRRNGSSSRPADRPRRTSMRTHRAR